MLNPNIISQVKALGSEAAINADPRFGPIAKNVLPLLGTINNTSRVKQKTLGEGTFGRVNLEVVNTGEVASKYFLDPSMYKENTNEIAVLTALKGLPYVAQLIKVTQTPPIKLPLSASQVTELEFPAAIMGKAIASLDNESLYASWDDVYSTIVQILRGYAVLQSQGIAHRDTKPQNMLMTSAGEVWINDFGKSIYTDDLIPITTKLSLGTPIYSAPELLMLRILDKKIPYNYFHSDAWSVGMSIYQILTNSTFIPFSNSRNRLLDELFGRLGYPLDTDGYIKTVFDEYKNSAYFQPIYAPNQYPVPGVSPGGGQPVFTRADAIKARIMTRTIHKPTDLTKLEAIADMVIGLLQYNPENRLKILEAHDQIAPIHFSVPPRRTIFDEYINTTPIKNTITSSDYKDDLYAIYIACVTHYDNKPELPFLIDRACIYLKSYLDKIVYPVNDDKLNFIVFISLFIAENLFNTNTSDIVFTPQKISETVAHLYDSSAVYEYCLFLSTDFLKQNIQFYGRTFFDTLIQSKEMTQEEFQTAALLNFLCHYDSIFPLYVGHLDLLRTRILDYMADPTKITLKPYLTNKTELDDNESNPIKLVTDFLTYIRQPIAGGKRKLYKKTRKQSKNRKSKRKQTRRK